MIFMEIIVAMEPSINTNWESLCKSKRIFMKITSGLQIGNRSN